VNSQIALAVYILPVSATLVGVCLTVISIIQLIEKGGHNGIIDEILAFDTILFLVSAFLSYMSLRSGRRAGQLERAADGVFMIGLCVMVFASFALAYEIG
jgi:uncharacterized membrane protein